MSTEGEKNIAEVEQVLRAISEICPNPTDAAAAASIACAVLAIRAGVSADELTDHIKMGMRMMTALGAVKQGQPEASVLSHIKAEGMPS